MIVEKIGRIPGLDGHARTEYYDALKRIMVLKGTAADLETFAKSQLDAEIGRVQNAALAEAQSEARELVAQARAQIEITHRDHDERLRNTLVALAQRSCSSPGSVTQEELDSLPQPYNGTFYAGKPYGGLSDDCFSLYLRLCLGERDTEEVKRMSILLTPAPAIAVPVESAVRAIAVPIEPPSQKFRLAIPFSSVLPTLKEYAVTACNSLGQVPLDKSLTHPYYPFHFSKEMDDRTADSLSAGLGSCDRQLFSRLIEVIRLGQGGQISEQWIRAEVAAFTRAPVYTQPPPRGTRCEDYNIKRCPKPE